MLGLEVTGTFKSERENVDEDICAIGSGPFKVEVDLMQPLDPDKKPAVHTTPLNHVGLWIDDLPKAVEWLTAQGVRFAPGGIREGAAGFDICFLHPKAQRRISDRGGGRVDRAGSGAARSGQGVRRARWRLRRSNVAAIRRLDGARSQSRTGEQPHTHGAAPVELAQTALRKPAHGLCSGRGIAQHYAGVEADEDRAEEQVLRSPVAESCRRIGAGKPRRTRATSGSTTPLPGCAATPGRHAAVWPLRPVPRACPAAVCATA